MTTAETIGNALAAAYDARIAHVYRLHPEATGAQMIQPRAAAASVGIEIDVDFGR
jgi:hypothetical protein